MWWRDGVLYQIYPRSWADSNGDGIGDLAGIVEHLDHLAWLGIDGIWINPVHDSPNDDWGYDVADYRSVHPDLGTVEDLERLIDEARARDIRVLLDLVPNHTSHRHPWFLDARSRRDARHRSWYVWADPRPDGSPPNNWLSAFGGPAWTLDEATGQYYLHNFFPEQPDLNWWEEEVREAFDDVLRFWFDRGVAGFRIDVAHAIVKDAELRDNLPVTEDDHEYLRRLGQRQVYNMNRPEVHDVLKRWRALASGYEPERILIGETYVLDVELMAAYYGTGEDELNLAFNFPFIFSPLDAAQMREIVEATERVIPPAGWPVWTGSNHDVGRLATRWCEGDDDRIRCALLILLTLRGTPFLYYGDEIGMGDVAVPFEALRDPVGIRRWPTNRGRDRARTPMRWTPEPGAGFTTAGAEPWLPIGEQPGVSVAEQRDDPRSVLRLCRDLIALRRASADVRSGGYATVPAPVGAWAWRRGDGTLVAVNLGPSDVLLDDVRGTVAISTRRDRDGEPVSGELPLRTREGVVVRLA